MQLGKCHPPTCHSSPAGSRNPGQKTTWKTKYRSHGQVSLAGSPQHKFTCSGWQLTVHRQLFSNQHREAMPPNLALTMAKHNYSLWKNKGKMWIHLLKAICCLALRPNGWHILSAKVQKRAPLSQHHLFTRLAACTWCAAHKHIHTPILSSSLSPYMQLDRKTNRSIAHGRAQTGWIN